MNEVLLARQPILNGDLTAVGYELLYREAGSDEANVRDDALAWTNETAKHLLDGDQPNA